MLHSYLRHSVLRVLPSSRKVTLPTVAKRLLERTPAPKAWLTTDDLLRPAPQETWKQVKACSLQKHAV